MMSNCTGIGSVSPNFGNGLLGFGPLLDSRRPIICLGQSNMENRLQPASLWNPYQQASQDAAYAVNDPAPLEAIYPNWQRIIALPLSTGGASMGHFRLNLAYGLVRSGVRAAFIEWAKSGEALTYWLPGSPDYAAMTAFVLARLSELTNSLKPQILLYQGESGPYADPDYFDALVTFASTWRALIGVPDAGLTLVWIPSNFYDPSVRAQQERYNAQDPNSRGAVDDASTFLPDATHIDAATQEVLALGPNSVGPPKIVSIMSCINSLIDQLG